MDDPETDIEPPALSRNRLTLIVLIIAISAFMQLLDGSILSVAIPAMAKAFGASPVALGVAITAYVMASLILLPASGWLADRIGPRRLFVGALLAFTATSGLCGLSANLAQLAGARILQGFSGAVLGPVGAVMLMRLIPRRDLLVMMNLFSAPMLAAPVIGPPLGGLITTLFGWPWIFYLNIPIGLLGAGLALKFIPEHTKRRRPFDTPGFMLMASALAALVYGAGEVGTGAGHIGAGLAALALGGVLSFYAVRRARRHPHPLVSLAPLGRATFRLVSAEAMPFMRLPVAALPFVLPIMLQVGLGFSPLTTGFLFLGHASGDLVMKLFTRPLFTRIGYRAAMMGAVIGFASMIMACALIGHSTPVWALFGLLTAGGCCRSVLGSGIGTLSYAEVPPGEMTSATTLSQILMQLIQAVGVAVTMVLLNLTAWLRGGHGGSPSVGDCAATLLVVGTVSLGALIPLGRLARDAGAEMAGRINP